jgi:hypothetical protein
MATFDDLYNPDAARQGQQAFVESSGSAFDPVAIRTEIIKQRFGEAQRLGGIVGQEAMGAPISREALEMDVSRQLDYELMSGSGVLGYITSSAKAMGAGILKSVASGLDDLGIWKSDVNTEFRKIMDEEYIQKHHMQSQKNIQLAFEQNGLTGRYAVQTAQTAADIALFLLMMKGLGAGGRAAFGIKPSVASAATGAAAAKGGLAAQMQLVSMPAVKTAASRAAFRFATADVQGETEEERLNERVKAAGITFAYMVTPALSGLSHTGVKAKVFDFLLNSGVTLGTGQYENAWKEATYEADRLGNMDFRLGIFFGNLAQLVGSDAAFSAMTKSLTRQAGEAMARPEAQGGAGLRDLAGGGRIRDNVNIDNVVRKYFENRESEKKPNPQGWEAMDNSKLLSEYYRYNTDVEFREAAGAAGVEGADTRPVSELKPATEAARAEQTRVEAEAQVAKAEQDRQARAEELRSPEYGRKLFVDGDKTEVKVTQDELGKEGFAALRSEWIAGVAQSEMDKLVATAQKLGRGDAFEQQSATYKISMLRQSLTEQGFKKKEVADIIKAVFPDGKKETVEEKLLRLDQDRQTAETKVTEMLEKQEAERVPDQEFPAAIPDQEFPTRIPEQEFPTKIPEREMPEATAKPETEAGKPLETAPETPQAAGAKTGDRLPKTKNAQVIIDEREFDAELEKGSPLTRQEKADIYDKATEESQRDLRSAIDALPVGSRVQEALGSRIWEKRDGYWLEVVDSRGNPINEVVAVKSDDIPAIGGGTIVSTPSVARAGTPQAAVDPIVRDPYNGEMFEFIHKSDAEFSAFSKDKVGTRDQGAIGVGHYFSPYEGSDMYGKHRYTARIAASKVWKLTNEEAFSEKYHGKDLNKIAEENGYDAIAIVSTRKTNDGKDVVVIEQLKVLPGKESLITITSKDGKPVGTPGTPQDAAGEAVAGRDAQTPAPVAQRDVGAPVAVSEKPVGETQADLSRTGETQTPQRSESIPVNQPMRPREVANALGIKISEVPEAMKNIPGMVRRDKQWVRVEVTPELDKQVRDAVEAKKVGVSATVNMRKIAEETGIHPAIVSRIFDTMVADKALVRSGEGLYRFPKADIGEGAANKGDIFVEPVRTAMSKSGPTIDYYRANADMRQKPVDMTERKYAEEARDRDVEAGIVIKSPGGKYKWAAGSEGRLRNNEIVRAESNAMQVLERFDQDGRPMARIAEFRVVDGREVEGTRKERVIPAASVSGLKAVLGRDGTIVLKESPQKFDAWSKKTVAEVEEDKIADEKGPKPIGPKTFAHTRKPSDLAAGATPAERLAELELREKGKTVSVMEHAATRGIKRSAAVAELKALVDAGIAEEVGVKWRVFLNDAEKQELADLRAEMKPAASQAVPAGQVRVRSREEAMAEGERNARQIELVKLSKRKNLTEKEQQRKDKLLNELGAVPVESDTRYQRGGREPGPVTRAEVTKQVEDMARKIKGTFTADRTASNVIGTLRKGPMRNMFIHEAYSEEAAGAVRRLFKGKFDYLTFINPETGMRTTVNHEMGHVLRDVLNKRERELLAKIGYEVDSLKGDERFAEAMETTEGRNALAEKLKNAAPAEQNVILRGINRVVDFINTVFGTELKHFGSAREFETLAGGIREFGLLRNIGERAAAARAEQGAREMTTDKTGDGEYLAAVERGDTETAQRMVDEAAKAAGLISGYHGTPHGGFNVFRVGTQGIHVGTKDQASVAARLKYISDNKLSYVDRASMSVKDRKKLQELDKKEPMRIYLTSRNPLVFDEDIFMGHESGFMKKIKDRFIEQVNAMPEQQRMDMANNGYKITKDERSFYELADGRIKIIDDDNRRFVSAALGDIGAVLSAKTSNDMFAALKTLGYDSIKYPNDREGAGYSYAVFNPAHIKVADAITRDDQGRVIPLSERFNEASPDIRFQKAKKLKNSDIEKILVDRYGRGNIRTAWKASGEKEYFKWRKAEAESIMSDNKAKQVAAEIGPQVQKEFEKEGTRMVTRFLESLPKPFRHLMQGQTAIDLVSPTLGTRQREMTRQSDRIGAEITSHIDQGLRKIAESGYRGNRKMTMTIGEDKVDMRLDEFATIVGYLRNPHTHRVVSNWVNIDGKRYYWLKEGKRLGLNFAKTMNRNDALSKSYHESAMAAAEREVQKVWGTLDKSERDVIENIIKLNNDKMNIEGRETRMIDELTRVAKDYIGREVKAVDGVYMPERIDLELGVERRGSTDITRVLREAGLIKSRKHHNNGMTIKGAMELTQQNTSTAALVIGQLPKTATLRAVLGQLQYAAGSKEARMVDDALEAVNRMEGQFSDTATNAFRKMLQLQDTARFARPTVWISQLASIPNAAAELGLGRVMGNMTGKLSNADFDKMLAMDPVLRERFGKNRFAPELRAHQSVRKGQQYIKQEGLWGAVTETAAKIRNIMMTPMGAFDKKAIRVVMGASLDWSKEQGFKGDELYQKAVDKTYDVIAYTQPSFSPEHRSLMATEQTYAARIFGRYRTMSDSALNQLVRTAVNMEREGFTKESVTRMKEMFLYSSIMPAIYLAVARPAVRTALGALEGKDDDDEEYTDKMLREGLAGMTYAVPYSQFWLTPLVQAVMSGDSQKGKQIVRRVQNEGGVLGLASGGIEVIYDSIDWMQRSDDFIKGVNPDGSRMDAADKRRAEATLARRTKRLIDNWGRNFDEATGLPLGQIQRAVMRGTEKALNENR